MYVKKYTVPYSCKNNLQKEGCLPEFIYIYKMNAFFKHKGYLIKHFCRFVLVFFALMPCAVKNTLFMEMPFQQTGTLNVSKIPGNAADSCAVYTPEKIRSQVAGIIRCTGADAERTVPYVPVSTFFSRSFRHFCHAANAPPFYILYKKLKIDATV